MRADSEYQAADGGHRVVGGQDDYHNGDVLYSDGDQYGRLASKSAQVTTAFHNEHAR